MCVYDVAPTLFLSGAGSTTDTQLRKIKRWASSGLHTASMEMHLPLQQGPSRTLVEALRERLSVQTGKPVLLIETHISWVLLTDRLAYKLKKPVHLPFVDFTTLASRKHFCEEEVRLNSRLAPTLYLGVAPVCGTEQAPLLDGPGAPIDYAVCMRRFASGALLSERLAAGLLLPEHVEGLARRLGEFHRHAPVAPPPRSVDAVRRVVAPVLRVLEQLRVHCGTARTGALETWVRAQAVALGPIWTARERDGHVRECHGDLHLANTVLVDGEVTAFDCIEFDPALRRIDEMSDVAFLTMDLQANGRSDLAFRFLDACLQCSGDYAGVRVLRFYEVYRALVRGLVNFVHPVRPPLLHRPDYIGCAERLVQGACRMPRLLITHGVSGSGKSTVASELLAAAGAIRLRSDVERKRLFGMTALERSAGGAIYGSDATARTFRRLAECARSALCAGYPVIVDAAFLRHAERDAFRVLAADLGATFTILHCTAGKARLHERVVTRAAAGTDASDADLQVLERQWACYEPLADDERAYALEISTDAPVDAVALCRRWLAQAQTVSGRAPVA